MQRRAAYMRYLIAYDLFNAIGLALLTVGVWLSWRWLRFQGLLVVLTLCMHFGFIAVTNVGLVLGRDFGPKVGLRHSALILLILAVNLVLSPDVSPHVDRADVIVRWAVAGTHCVIQCALLYLGYLAYVAVDEKTVLVATEESDLHSAASLVLAMATTADGNASAAKTRLAAQRLSDLMGTGATVEALERRINFALKSASDAALERACVALAANYSPEQLSWLQKAAAEIAGSDELACGWLEELAAKFGTT